MINVVTAYVTTYALQIDEDTYLAGDAVLAVHQDAIVHLAEESEALGVSAEIPRLFKVLVDRAVADGHADNGYAALIRQFRRPSMQTHTPAESGAP